MKDFKGKDLRFKLAVVFSALSVFLFLFVILINIPNLKEGTFSSVYFWIVTVVGMIVSVGMAYIGAVYASHLVAKPIQDIVDRLKEIEKGDFTIETSATGYAEVNELSYTVNKMTTSLSELINTVMDNTQQLKGISSIVNMASQETADSANQEAAAVAETSATLEELTRSFKSVATGAEFVKELSGGTLQASQDAFALVIDGKEKIEDVEVKTTELGSASLELLDTSNSIGQIVSIIQSINSQAKILALNTAIEAARLSGSDKSGFDVVAREMRSLTDSIGDETKRIEELIKNVQAVSNKIILIAEKQASSVKIASVAAESSSKVFREIVNSMENTASASEEIMVASKQQESASSQVSDAMTMVSGASLSNAQSAKEVTKAIEEMNRYTAEILSNIQRFKTKKKVD